MTVDAIVEQVLVQGHSLVEVTGGEPLYQQSTPELLVKLSDAGLEVLLETSGAISIAGIDPRVHVILDVKTPGSGMADQMCLDNLDLLTPGKDEVKFVVRSQGDFDWATALINEHGLSDRVAVLISPVLGTVEPSEAAEWILASGLPLRLQLQLHKIIWDGKGEPE